MAKLTELQIVLTKYLVEHSSRRLSYLYWNTIDTDETLLCFVNLTGNKLSRVNNVDLVFRVVRIMNESDWVMIKNFLDTYVVSPDDNKAAHIIRVDFLLSYLKHIGYDLSKFVLKRNAFGTAYSNNSIIPLVEEPEEEDDGSNDISSEELNLDEEDPKPKADKPIFTVDNDIQSLYLIEKLYNKYNQLLLSEDSEDWDIVDITQEYLTDLNFRYKLDDLRITVPVQDSIDIVSRKFIRTTLKENDQCKLEQLYLKHGISVLANRFTTPDMIVVTVRAYLQYFLTKFKSNKRP